MVEDDELMVDEQGPEAGTGSRRWSSVGRASRRAADSALRSALVRPGDILAHKYVVERIIGRSGPEMVVFGRHVELEQRVRIRYLLPEASASPEAVSRFQRGARKAREMRSEHAERVVDFGRLETGSPYRVSELPSGPSLEDILRVRGALDIGEAVDIMVQICEPVAEAHASRVVHRSLCTSNIFVERRPDGSLVVKVLDFGVSDSLELSPADGSVFGAGGASTGALGFASPEQIRNPGAVDARADIWALGAILYELLTGVRVFEAETPLMLLAMIAADQPAPINWLRPEMPPELEAMVFACLEKDPDRRPRSVVELRERDRPVRYGHRPERREPRRSHGDARLEAAALALERAAVSAQRPAAADARDRALDARRSPGTTANPSIARLGDAGRRRAHGSLRCARWCARAPASDRPARDRRDGRTRPGRCACPRRRGPDHDRRNGKRLGGESSTCRSRTATPDPETGKEDAAQRGTRSFRRKPARRARERCIRTREARARHDGTQSSLWRYRVSKLRAGFIASLFVLLSSGVALADEESDKARAKGLFAEAQALSEAGKYVEACSKFEESVKLHAGVGNQYQLADCWEKIGRTASAYEVFLKVVAKTRELGQPDREKAAQERADALAPKLTRLRIEVKALPNDFSLTRNGKAIAREDFGVPAPIDPGVQKLHASAPGKAAWSQEVEVPADPGTVIVTVPPLPDEKKPVAAAAVAPVKKEEPNQPPPPEEKSSYGTGRAVATVGLLAVGVGGLVAGAITGTMYLMSNNDAKAICPIKDEPCPDDDIEAHDKLVEDTKQMRTYMYASFGVAAVGLGGAAIIHFTAPSRKDRRDGASIGARVYVSREGAITGALQGRF